MNSAKEGRENRSYTLGDAADLETADFFVKKHSSNGEAKKSAIIAATFVLYEA